VVVWVWLGCVQVLPNVRSFESVSRPAAVDEEGRRSSRGSEIGPTDDVAALLPRSTHSHPLTVSEANDGAPLSVSE
jgi:hypothetical protein